MIRRIALLALVFTCGCGANYRVELWNDTGHPMDVRLAHLWGTYSMDAPCATVAPGGWFDYRISNGHKSPRRTAYVTIRGVDGSVELDLSDLQIFRGRVLWTGTRAVIEPINASQSAARRPPMKPTGS